MRFRTFFFIGANSPLFGENSRFKGRGLLMRSGSRNLWTKEPLERVERVARRRPPRNLRPRVECEVLQPIVVSREQENPLRGDGENPLPSSQSDFPFGFSMTVN